MFLGTPGEAVPSLRTLVELADVRLVVTRPDKPRGRSGRPQPSAVKVAAEELGLEVAQPSRSDELADFLRPLEIDVGVVAAFGMILRPTVLSIPRRGFLNVHFSLLPRWRGAAPVERAIMAGDDETGVTIMSMDPGLDTGPIVAQRLVPIGHDETGGELRERLSHLGADLLADTLPGWVAGEIEAVTQDESDALYASRIEPADRLITIDMSVVEACDRIRALAPRPGARLQLDGEFHKLLVCRPAPFHLAPGVWRERDGAPFLGLADGAVEVVSIQPPGRRPMSGEAWLRGHTLPSTG